MNDYPATHEHIAQAQAERAHWQAMMDAAALRLRADYYTAGDTLCGHRATADTQRAADDAAGGLVALACASTPAHTSTAQEKLAAAQADHRTAGALDAWARHLTSPQPDALTGLALATRWRSRREALLAACPPADLAELTRVIEAWEVAVHIAAHIPTCPHCDWPVGACHCEPEPVLRDPCSVCGEGEAVRHVPSDRTEDVVAGFCAACAARIDEYVLGLQLAERGE